MITMYAVVGKSILNGEEGIIAAIINGLPIPMISMKRENMERFKQLAEDSVGHTDVRMIKLVETETVSEFKTHSDV